MEKATDSSLFVNDGSFLERFKQRQQEEGKDKKSDTSVKSKSGSNTSVTNTPKTVISKATLEFKANGSRKTNQAPSSGKLAFSLKQKSKLAAPSIKLGEDEDEDENDDGNLSDRVPMKRPKLDQQDAPEKSLRQVVVAPPSPSDPTVKKVVDKLASFVAKHGRQFEHITRQKNPGDTPFKFLFDESCSDYKYYEYKLSEEQNVLSETRDSQTSQSVGSVISVPNSSSGSQRLHHQHSKYQTPSSALYEPTENTRASTASVSSEKYGESSAPTGADPIAMMEYYMKKAAQEEKQRPPKPSKDEMPPPASLQASSKKGHHMGDYIPPEELEKFLSTCNDAAARKAAIECAERAKIQADNVGHRLLSKMGWKEGTPLLLLFPFAHKQR
ncbi:SURP and G-patch domain-containing protein 1-like protein isoform X1 [Olea europaea var. sylvestris]|uniref:SURP and G-patch domain-containing protein 1-like protein isoform X1 n=1 Tax=Olea europaea var. sylvestris TaxID=158386 RepID=UPI000C1D06FB|nr:SURP and G-patch domain-containing protein 1-like protein isoform X1 [Olea europaea var. sylvestris]XP_022876671.1 SURP and G-patch domain-containing protein 1-like protein isoform X1 [Olea europaea var. sylvestris]XP_022876672.1 SURP and G-patch domain-containing protein 1-like protein isoform X1 [Olea europaea var. sylvestris]